MDNTYPDGMMNDFDFGGFRGFVYPDKSVKSFYVMMLDEKT